MVILTGYHTLVELISIENLGLTDVVDEGQFVWASDGSAANYTNWNSGEPRSGNKRCAAISAASTSYKWFSTHCTEPLYPLCQVPC